MRKSQKTNKMCIYPVSGCKISTPRESKESLFYGLSEKEIKEVWKFFIPEKLPNGIVFYSLRNAVKRFRCAKENIKC